MITDDKTLEKLRNKYIGKRVEMFKNNWFCDIVDLDELGWTFKIVKPYYNTNDQVGDILFYSYTEPMKFKILK